MDTPSWDEGIQRLLAKLTGLVANGSITINDARTIQHLAERCDGGCAACWNGHTLPLIARVRDGLTAKLTGHDRDVALRDLRAAGEDEWLRQVRSP